MIWKLDGWMADGYLVKQSRVAKRFVQSQFAGGGVPAGVEMAAQSCEMVLRPDL